MMSPERMAQQRWSRLPWLMAGQLPTLAEAGGLRAEARFLSLPSRHAWTYAWNPWESTACDLDRHALIASGTWRMDDEQEGSSTMASCIPLASMRMGLESHGLFDLGVQNALSKGLLDEQACIIATQAERTAPWDGFMVFRRDLVIRASRIDYVVDPGALCAANRAFALPSLLACFRRQVTCDLEHIAVAMRRNGALATIIGCKVLGDPDQPGSELVKEIARLVDLARGSIFGPNGEYAPADMERVEDAFPLAWTNELFSPADIVFDAYDFVDAATSN